METENENKSTDKKEGVASAAAPAFPVNIGRAGRSFSERMGEAGYIAGRRYDAVKNAFLSYKPADKKGKNLRSRISRSGEKFYAGKKLLAALCLTGNTLRLFMALDPVLYNADKYHHKDYSDKPRYAKTPFMIRLSSARQEKYAVELIGELLSANGFVPDENYIAKDRADIFKKPKRARVGQSAATAVLPSVSDVAASETEPEFFDGFETADVKLPVRAAVVDKAGDRTGKIRKSVWTDDDGKERGYFVKRENNVLLYEDGALKGYVDKNDNILSAADGYLATIRRRPHYLAPLVIVILAALTLITAFLCAYFITCSGNSDYEPVIFMASEDGTAWKETENIPVFANEIFGDSKIAPGMRGSYRFVFENRNKNKLVYSLSFSEVNEYGISIVYRLKRDGAYLTGTEEYVGVNALGAADLTIESGSSTLFELEWHWIDNDEADTAAGENSAIYSLNISLSAYVDV